MNAQSSSRKLVLAPATPWPAIEQAVCEMGYLLSPDTAVTPPMTPGEREFATWTSDATHDLISYSFNPVVDLRVIDIESRSASAIAEQVRNTLPCMDAEMLRTLLGSPDLREVLLGLMATAELEAISLLPAAEELRVHTDRTVSQVAAKTAESLGMAVINFGT